MASMPQSEWNRACRAHHSDGSSVPHGSAFIGSPTGGGGATV